MKLTHLRFFLNVAEERHFGRAAERIGMTQPPLSLGIRALERELGVVLFTRNKRRVELTPVGRQLVDHARAIVESTEQLPALARRMAAGEAGSLKLGFVSTADYSLLPDLVGDYRRAYPDVQVGLREMTSDLQVEAVLQGGIDAGLIIPLTTPVRPPLAYLPLLREPLIAAVPEAWVETGRLASDGWRVKLADLCRHPLVIFPRSSSPGFHDVITGYIGGHGIMPIIGQEAIQMQTIVSLVSAEMGVALVPQSLERLGRSGTRYLELTETPPLIETGLIWRESDTSPIMTHFVDIARSR
ncbi:DNA-binding transcriptional LysR family regulator [Aquamicrobium terrae]